MAKKTAKTGRKTAKTAKSALTDLSTAEATIEALLAHGIATVYCHTRHEQGAAYTALGAAPALFRQIPSGARAAAGDDQDPMGFAAQPRARANIDRSPGRTEAVALGIHPHAAGARQENRKPLNFFHHRSGLG